MNTHRHAALAALLVATASLTACGDDTTLGEGGGGTGSSTEATTTDATTSTAGEGGQGEGGQGEGGQGGGGVEAPEGLVACELPVSCGSYFLSDAGGYSPSDTSCILALARSGASGSFTDSKGGIAYEDDALSVLLGDGTAIRQRRSASCAAGPCEPYAYQGFERCDVIVPKEAEACDDTSCSVPPPDYISGCAPMPTESCADVLARIVD